VIKLEDPIGGGDLARYIPPFQEREDSLYFETFNRGKRSVSLDLRTAAGRRVFEDLAARVDVLFANVRGDVFESLGIGYECLGERNPRLVCCSLSGYGRTGPRAAEGAYDHTIQAIAGWQHLTGEPDGPPSKSGISVVDFSAGYAAAAAVVAAVLGAQRTGQGCDIDLSLHEVALAQLSYLATWTASRGYEPVRQRRSMHPTIVPFQTFRAADGWLVIACPKDSHWRRLCEAIERPDLVEDSRFASLGDRSRHRELLIAELEGVFVERTISHLLRQLRAAGVPCAPVNDVKAALDDPQVGAREALVHYDHPQLGRVCQPASALRVGVGGTVPGPAPARGEHTDVVLRQVCDYDEGTLAALSAAGAFGPAEPASAPRRERAASAQSRCE